MSVKIADKKKRPAKYAGRFFKFYDQILFIHIERKRETQSV